MTTTGRFAYSSAEVPLVLGLEVDAPGDRELARPAGSLRGPRSPRCTSIRTKLDVDELLEPAIASLSMRSAKKAMSSGRSSSSDAEDRLEQVLGEVGVVVEVGEGDLRLDHPELGEVAARVRVLRAEGGPERVDVGQRQAVGLDVELARDGQEGGLAEEVLRVVDRAVGRARQVRQVERRDAEHLARALGVAGGDDRRVDPVEAVLVEVAVDRHGQRSAGPGPPRRRCSSAAAGGRPRGGTRTCAASAEIG